MVFITAIFGGFYLHTFWPLWSPQVVIIQQLNLLLSLEITGTDIITAIRAFKKWERGRRNNVLLVRNGSCSQLPSSSPQHAETTEDNLPDENETRMAQEWSKTMESQTCLVDDEMVHSTIPASSKSLA